MKRDFLFFLSLFTFALNFLSCNGTNPITDPPVEGRITSFSIVDQRSVKYVLHIDNVNKIISNKQTIPAYVNLTQLVVHFETNNYDIILKVGDEVQVSGMKRYDFTQERVYDLYVDDEKQKSYVVRITKPDLQNNFRTFTFPEKQMEPYQPTINVENGEITHEGKIPSNVNITSLKPEFTTTEENAIVKVEGVVQKSGVSSHDSSKPVVYTIEGEDGTSKCFTVTLEQSDEAFLTNPIMAGSYADPTVIRVGNEFYLYVTSGRVRGYKSTDMLNWERINDTYSEVFTKRPDFVEVNPEKDGPGMWAPDINYFDGKYVMYYSISQWGEGSRCGIGVGVSTKPQGPFTPPAGNPNGKLFISTEIGVHNSIDPCFFEENGRRYLFWGSFNGIYVTELTADGMAVKDLSKKTKVAGKSFEATYIHKRGNYYYLFASIGACCEGMTSSYKVVVGRSTKLEGPYLSKTGSNMNNFDAWNPSNYQPIIMRGDAMFGGPGHNSRIITDDNGVDWMFYHAYTSDEVNSDTNRQLMLDKVEWDENDWPTLGYGTPSYTMKVAPVFR